MRAQQIFCPENCRDLRAAGVMLSSPRTDFVTPRSGRDQDTFVTPREHDDAAARDGAGARDAGARRASTRAASGLPRAEGGGGGGATVGGGAGSAPRASVAGIAPHPFAVAGDDVGAAARARATRSRGSASPPLAPHVEQRPQLQPRQHWPPQPAALARTPSPDVPTRSVAQEQADTLARLLSAARHGRTEEVRALLEARGVSVDARDVHGNSCLHVACQNGHRKVAKLALRAGANPDAQNLKGNTPAHYCFAYGFDELGEYLVAKGASEHVRNAAGKRCREGLG